MLDAEAIDRLADHVNVNVEEYDGVHFHVGADGAKALVYPKRAAVHVFGLDQLLNYAREALTEDTGAPALINVLSENRVQIIDAAEDKNRAVNVFAEVDFSKLYASFPFGKELTQEQFIIELMTKFVDDEARTELLNLVSKVRAEKIRASDDDGFSQVVSTKAGAVLAQEQQIKNLWILKTFKTFPEIDQPEIPYVLRLYQRDSEMPKFALHDCDGGAWKVNVAKKIREYCHDFVTKNQLKHMKVL